MQIVWDLWCSHRYQAKCLTEFNFRFLCVAISPLTPYTCNIFSAPVWSQVALGQVYFRTRYVGFPVSVACRQSFAILRLPRTLYNISSWLTPWRAFLKKLTGPQLIKRFTALYGTRRFIAAFTTSRLLSLSRARSVHFIASPSQFSKIPF